MRVVCRLCRLSEEASLSTGQRWLLFYFVVMDKLFRTRVSDELLLHWEERI
ncbi:hypothetical protein [Sporomusa acidovorans]|uniref:hypothetical protein n=1 Tax=Sporomusa acidovorans TaxID=112900 RepID=UPI00146C3672|nr:hypothetical protein [Sporomusa acidovorans]